jgi:hypothetical protein
LSGVLLGLDDAMITLGKGLADIPYIGMLYKYLEFNNYSFYLQRSNGQFIIDVGQKDSMLHKRAYILMNAAMRYANTLLIAKQKGFSPTLALAVLSDYVNAVFSNPYVEAKKIKDLLVPHLELRFSMSKHGKAVMYDGSGTPYYMSEELQPDNLYYEVLRNELVPLGMKAIDTALYKIVHGDIDDENLYLFSLVSFLDSIIGYGRSEAVLSTIAQYERKVVPTSDQEKKIRALAKSTMATILQSVEPVVDTSRYGLALLSNSGSAGSSMGRLQISFMPGGRNFDLARNSSVIKTSSTSKAAWIAAFPSKALSLTDSLQDMFSLENPAPIGRRNVVGVKAQRAIVAVKQSLINKEIILYPVLMQYFRQNKDAVFPFATGDAYNLGFYDMVSAYAKRLRTVPGDASAFDGHVNKNWFLGFADAIREWSVFRPAVYKGVELWGECADYLDKIGQSKPWFEIEGVKFHTEGMMPSGMKNTLNLDSVVNYAIGAQAIRNIGDSVMLSKNYLAYQGDDQLIIVTDNGMGLEDLKTIRQSMYDTYYEYGMLQNMLKVGTGIVSCEFLKRITVAGQFIGRWGQISLLENENGFSNISDREFIASYRSLASAGVARGWSDVLMTACVERVWSILRVQKTPLGKGGTLVTTFPQVLLYNRASEGGSSMVPHTVIGANNDGALTFLSTLDDFSYLEKVREFAAYTSVKDMDYERIVKAVKRGQVKTLTATSKNVTVEPLVEFGKYMTSAVPQGMHKTSKEARDRIALQTGVVMRNAVDSVGAEITLDALATTFADVIAMGDTFALGMTRIKSSVAPKNEIEYLKDHVDIHFDSGDLTDIYPIAGTTLFKIESSSLGPNGRRYADIVNMVRRICPLAPKSDNEILASVLQVQYITTPNFVADVLMVWGAFQVDAQGVAARIIASIIAGNVPIEIVGLGVAVSDEIFAMVDLRYPDLFYGSKPLVLYLKSLISISQCFLGLKYGKRVTITPKPSLSQYMVKLKFKDLFTRLNYSSPLQQSASLKLE